jgi:hypothetical protein
MKKWYNYLLALALVLLISPLVFAGNGTDAGHIKRMIAFTTQTSVKLEITFEELPSSDLKYAAKITDDASGKIVFDGAVTASSVSKEENKIIFSINNLKVNEWTPVHPNLYQITFTASDGKGDVQQKNQRIGFRFFEAKNSNLYLNGHPIFLRGIAINPPGRGIPDSIETSRKFAHDYISFMKSIHVNIIRIPDDSTWYNVCDELGMMVFGGNYSGSVDGEKPPTNYDKAVAWYENEKFAPISHHPSLMIYAMTNEVAFRGKLAEPWRKFLTYAHEQLLKWDNTRVYIGNAGYGYGQSGDICDLHRYWGWYYNSPFTFLHIRYNKDIIPFEKKSQPITFTECVGNYTGPGGEYNLTPNHKNPGSQLNWTGHADWNIQAQLANEHQSFTFKNATELFRRLRSVNPELSGVFPFTILFYNWNTVKKFIDMDPKPVTEQAKLSYQPVLLSWENWNTHLYTNTSFEPIVHIVNDADDFSNLENAKLIYQLADNSNKILFSDTLNLPTIKYYAAWQSKLKITIPSPLPEGNYILQGKIISGKKIIAQNFDKLFIADKNFIESSTKPAKEVLVYDPSGKTTGALDKITVKYKRITSLKNIPSSSVILISENGADENLIHQANAISQFVKTGGRIIYLRQDVIHFENLNKLLGYKLKNVTMNLDTSVYPPPPRPSRNGYYVNPERPEHPVFAGVDRNDLKVWSDYTNWDESQKGFPAIYPVTDGFVPVNKKDIEHISVLGNYGVALESIAIAEIFEGKGSELVCGLDLVNRAGIDPIADKILTNIIGYMGNENGHMMYPLITAPIVWGDYKTEKGILTGVNSGLILNAKPRLTDDFSKIKLNITKDGHELAGNGGGFNTRPGLQYVHYGRRPFGPYSLRDFGNIPDPDNKETNIGEGTFWCSIPAGKRTSSTIAWNPSTEDLELAITLNGETVKKVIKAGETISVDCPVHSTTVQMKFSGDRRLVLLETIFK